MIVAIAARRRLLTSTETMAEALEVAARLADEAPAAADNVASVLELIAIVGPGTYGGSMDDAALVLRNAPASRNGSTTDAHVLALAWTYDADIWSHDRDFAGTGWPSWSSANLAAALSEEASTSLAER